MIRTLKCPNCNAPIHVSESHDVAKCEYCDTEIIISNHKKLSASNTADYEKLRKKWNKSIIMADIIQVVISLFFVIFTDSSSDIISGVGVLLLFVSATYSVALPIHLTYKRPVNPKSPPPSKLSTGFKLYGLFLLSFVVTAFFTIIIQVS